MTFFLASVVAALSVAVIAQAITIAHLAERTRRRPRPQRPGPRVDPHPVDPTRPYRTAATKPRRSLLADTTEVSDWRSRAS